MYVKKNKCKTTHNIDKNYIIKANTNLKNIKYDYVFEISSNNIKNGTDTLFSKLAVLFDLMISHGVSNENLNRSIIKSIPKDKRKPLSCSNNYRGISLSSIISKLFEYVIYEKIKSNLKSSDCQFGFRSNHSTTLCSSVLNQTIEYYLNGGSVVYGLFLDASKAFDRVKHSKLFERLIENGVCPLYLRILFIMYKFNNALIKWNGKYSDPITMNNGVKQGSILSP